MDLKIKKQTPRDRTTLVRRPKDAAALLSFLGLNAQLAAELRFFYETSVSEPMPEKLRELLAQLSQRPNGR